MGSGAGLKPQGNLAVFLVEPAVHDCWVRVWVLRLYLVREVLGLLVWELIVAVA